MRLIISSGSVLREVDFMLPRMGDLDLHYPMAPHKLILQSVVASCRGVVFVCWLGPQDVGEVM